MEDVPPNVEWLGTLPQREVYEMIGKVACLMMPSQCYESFARVIVEAYSRGTPVSSSNIGGQAELSTLSPDLLFDSQSPTDLARKVEQLFSEPEKLARLRPAARSEFEAYYTASDNYEQLITIYRPALRRRGNDAAADEEIELPKTNRHNDELGRRASSGPSASVPAV
jgi:glycosyltransferase involved in cell wall biosynthesis